MVRHKPFLLAISGIRKTYSRFPASSLHRSFKEALSNGLRVTIGHESITCEPLIGFEGSSLCSSTSTMYHLPIICNQISKIARECEQRNVFLLLHAVPPSRDPKFKAPGTRIHPLRKGSSLNSWTVEKQPRVDRRNSRSEGSAALDICTGVADRQSNPATLVRVYVGGCM